jgi:hypothetical protein
MNTSATTAKKILKRLCVFPKRTGCQPALSAEAWKRIKKSPQPHAWVTPLQVRLAVTAVPGAVSLEPDKGNPAVGWLIMRMN